MGIIQTAVREARASIPIASTESFAPIPIGLNSDVPIDSMGVQSAEPQNFKASQIDVDVPQEFESVVLNHHVPEESIKKEKRSTLREVPPDSVIERGARGIQGPLMADSGEAPVSSTTKMINESARAKPKESVREKSQPESESKVLLESMFSRSSSVASLGRPVLPTYAIETEKPRTIQDVIVSNRPLEELSLGKHTGPGTPSEFSTQQMDFDKTVEIHQALPAKNSSLLAEVETKAENFETKSVHTQVSIPDSFSKTTTQESLRLETRFEKRDAKEMARSPDSRMTHSVQREIQASPSVHIGQVEVFITAAPVATRNTIPISKGSLSSRNYLRRA